MLTVLSSGAAAQGVPPRDARLDEIRHLDLKYEMPVYTTRKQWEARAVSLRQQILVSSGLWPMPHKGALRAEIFGRVDRGEYTIEKVYFESYPGHFVTGNLYRPKNPRNRVPAILNPHGHWAYGRMENTPTASLPLRAANFARMGMVAFTYDMVGYADNQAISHRFAPGHREDFDRAALWSLNLLGLQLWNSIRALDFLLTLPEVDPERIGCTGASGGGTQTFLLAAVDDRVKVSAPVNMISSIMQGGSLCENAPLLRIDTNNMELGALTAPRPMLMVSATGDWTKNTPSVEYPAILGIYRLFGAERNLRTIQIDAPHNYNQLSREAVYGWFAHHLLGASDPTRVAERERGVASLPEQMVFFGRTRPAGELDEQKLLESLIAEAQRRLKEDWPHDKESLTRFDKSYGGAFRDSIMVESPEPASILAEKLGEQVDTDGAVSKRETIALSRRGHRDRVEAIYWSPQASAAKRAAVLMLMSPTLNEADLEQSRVLRGALLRAGHAVLAIRPFDSASRPATTFKFYTTYNRADDANRVQDILTALAYLRHRAGDAPIKVIARGRAGLWALLARAVAPEISRMAVDIGRFDTARDEAYLDLLPIPGIRRAGDFATALLLAPPAPLLIHNAGGRFDVERSLTTLRKIAAGVEMRAESEAMNPQDVINWLLRDEPRK